MGFTSRRVGWAGSVVLAGVLTSGPGSADPAPAAKPTPAQIVDQMLDHDAWGLGGAEVDARAVTHQGSSQREYRFSIRSHKVGPRISKMIARFSAPADVAGTGFLQVQKSDGEDDRFLFLPELKKTKRIGGDLRSRSFMSTDLSYGDLDRRDLRESNARLIGEEKFEGSSSPVYHLDVVPRRSDPEYPHAELWIRTDNFIALKMVMYGTNGAPSKTIQVQEIKRVSGAWFATKALITNHKDSRSTELFLDRVVPKDDIPDDEFTLRALEKP